TGRFIQIKRLSQLFVDFLNRNTKPTPLNRSSLFKLLNHAHGYFNRNRKGQAHKSARSSKNLRVNSYHLAVKIKQRAAGVTWVDSHISLDKWNIALIRQTASF